MDSDRQSTAPPSSAGSGRVVAPVLSLLLLLGVCALRLDGREFSIGEANHAWAALGALEGDARTPGSGPAHGFLRGFGTAVTTTPRGLRLSVVLGLILAALLVGEIACRLHGPTARPFAYVAVAACPLAGAGTLLYPGLLAMLPMAALLGVAVFLVRGGPGWMIIATVGAAGAACTAPLPIVVLTIIAIPWLVPFHPRPVGTAIATVIPLGVVGATTWASGVPAWPLAAPARALDEPSVFDVFFESGLTGGLPFLGLAVVCVFVIGAAHPSRRRRVMARGAVLVAAAVGYGAWMMIDAPATGDTILSPSATA
ncbi:MAG: hypothetical protein CMJ18_16815, partial [Phycisphaeraceae bacterium]|nr:hypothetical protein [Phycisphaeraceae bacterium]